MSRQLAELSLYNYWTNTVQFWTQKIQIKIWIFFRTSNNGATSLCIVSRQLRFTSDYFPISVYKLTNSQGGNSMNKSTTHLYFTFYLPNPRPPCRKLINVFVFKYLGQESEWSFWMANSLSSLPGFTLNQDSALMITKGQIESGPLLGFSISADWIAFELRQHSI